MLLALKRWFERQSHQSPARRNHRRQLTLDRLEDRTVPAAIQYAVGAGAGGGPQVNCYDKTGALVIAFQAYAANFTGGVNVAVGDVTGDGVLDVVTSPGAGGGPDIRVWDGAALANGIIRTVDEFSAYDPNFRGGVYIAVGDITGDGIADVVTGPGAGGGPHIKAFNGTSISAGSANPTILLSFLGYDPAFTGGVRLGVGDFGGDNGQNPNGTFRPGGFAGSHAGKREIVTGPGPGGGANVRFWDYDQQINDPDNFGNLSGDQVFPGWTGGIFVAGGFITNNIDNEFFVYADLVVSVDAGGGPHVRTFRLSGVADTPPRNNFIYIPANEVEPGDPAMVNLNFAGASFFPYAGNFTGGVRVGVIPDVNSDGADDYLTGPGKGGGPNVLVLNGKTLGLLQGFNAFDPAFTGGIFVGG